MSGDLGVGRQRVGIGTDTHRLVAGRPLWVGGVSIPADFGALGHSDGDVAIHALIDALLGAAALGDIGELFPDTDPKLSGIRSDQMLETVCAKLQQAGWCPINVDIVVELERPKLLPYRLEIRERLAELLGVTVNEVFLKAKTGEGLAPIGTGEAISSIAVVLLAACCE